MIITIKNIFEYSEDDFDSFLKNLSIDINSYTLIEKRYLVVYYLYEENYLDNTEFGKYGIEKVSNSLKISNNYGEFVSSLNNFIYYTNLKTDVDEFKRFSELVIQNNLYNLVTKFVYKININKKDYILYNYNTDNLIRPFIVSHKLMVELKISDDDKFLQYIKEHCYNFTSINNYLLKNNKVASLSPKQDVENYMWGFLIEKDKIIASIITDYINNKTLHIQYINSYQENKGNCKLICSYLMSKLREWNIDNLRLESVGGISGNKCYIRSFLLSQNGYNYVYISNDEIKLIMNKKEGEIWINSISNNENYEMIFYDK